MPIKKFHYHNPVGRTIYFTSLVILLIAVITLSTYLYWVIQDSNILQIKNNPVPVEKTKVKGGDIQIVDIAYCKNADIKGYVTWELISDKAVIILPPYEDTNVQGCNSGLRAPIILPDVVYTDKYHLYWNITYQVDPVKTITTQFTSQEFTIIGKDGVK